MLLCNFPLGVQIRFEHNLEQWRYKIGKPLNVHRCCHESRDFRCKASNDQDPLRIEDSTARLLSPRTQPSEPQQQKFQIIQLDEPTTVEESSVHNNDELIVPYNNATPPETPLTNRSLTSSTDSPKKSSQSMGTGSANDVIQSIHYMNNNKSYGPRIDLEAILRSSKPDGVQLIKIYNTRKSFSRPERRRLINVIVTYFLRHDMRLDLQTTYALEGAILKMFPNERLEMYRKSKRGSLYSKYMNAKKSIFYSQRKRRSIKGCIPEISEDCDETIESSDMETMAFTEDTISMGEGAEPSVTNTAMENEEDDISRNEEDNYKINLVKPKIELDSEYV